jgi:hypothetical protein
LSETARQPNAGPEVVRQALDQVRAAGGLREAA